MQLPQEYWGKQTIFEIAFGLGTPLTIDDATQNRRFGLFARGLIDVDLSKKMYESVIIEREGHALAILVQYKRHPLFCAHCKSIGHNIQSCSKLHVDANAQASKKARNMSHKVQFKSNLFNKKNVQLSVHKSAKTNNVEQAQLHNVAVGNKPAQVLIHTEHQEDTFDSANDFEEEEYVAQDINESGVHNTAHHADVQTKTNEDRLNITLHNSFELLENDVEPITGEAKSSDKDSTPITLDMQMDKNPNMKEQSLGKGILDHSRNIEVPAIIDRQCALITTPIFYDNITLQPVITLITTTDEILGPDKRKMQFTVGPKNMYAACLKDGKALSKLLGVEPDTDTITTTDEVLVLAKGKVQVSGGSKNVSAASMKSVQNLSKSLGDEVDTDPATDSTMEQDTDFENLIATLKFPPDADKYLNTPLEIGKFTKSDRKSRKHKSLNGKGSGGITSSEHIQTRSKKGVIKSNPKYV